MAFLKVMVQTLFFIPWLFTVSEREIWVHQVAGSARVCTLMLARTGCCKRHFAPCRELLK
jgi:hypothetical protein